MSEPTGMIWVDGEPMRFWLPDGVTPEDIGVKTIDLDQFDIEDGKIAERLLSTEPSPLEIDFTA